MEGEAVFTGALKKIGTGPGLVILSDSEVKDLLSIEEAIEAVERGFILAARNESVMPVKQYLALPAYGGDFRAMAAYIDGLAGIKWVSVYPRNSSRGLPSVQAVIVLSDPATGSLLAFMDGTYITSVRTGAAGAVAVKYLARKNSSILGMVGAGIQARMQLVAISKILPIKKVKVYDIKESARKLFISDMKRLVESDILPVDSVEEASDADILVTTTPSREPLVKEGWVKPGTHINAIGADAPGKQEIESGLVSESRVVVDDAAQACHSGEINVPILEGTFKCEGVAGTLGEVITGSIPGRRSDRDITIFDSTGLAIQDIMCAGVVYRKINAT